MKATKSIDGIQRATRKVRCLICGEMASPSTFTHGKLDPSTWHTPEFEEPNWSDVEEGDEL